MRLYSGNIFESLTQPLISFRWAPERLADLEEDQDEE